MGGLRRGAGANATHDARERDRLPTDINSPGRPSDRDTSWHLGMSGAIPSEGARTDRGRGTFSIRTGPNLYVTFSFRYISVSFGFCFVGKGKVK